MTLPPGFLDELRARVSIVRVIGRKVAWDLRKSNPGKGDYWAPCPFHQERTASFHVDERKGYYYCFGCQAKGDVLTFLRETENLGFWEAVEVLAREAGLAVPARDPAERARADRASQLIEVCAAAARFWRGQLASAAAAGPARAYLDRRGVGPAARERFGLGYAAEGRQVLWDHLRSAGLDPDLIVEAGLCARPDDGGPPYDRFRDRIIFPICDARGRAIAFGGRAMAADARAKYLNSPDTPLFDKGRTLYNIGPARAALARGGPLIVAEGYMDVIALSEAGFAAAVAPLGTAITPEQLHLMWRLHPEPLIALDGDRAGLRAGERLAELALPLIGAGRGLRFALLPAGQDPDDLIRAGGPAAMQAVLDRSVPMARLLWERETAGRVFDTPERRAALDRRLGELAGRIADRSLREEYRREFRRLREALFAPPPRAPGGRAAARRPQGGPRGAPLPPVLPATRASRLAAGDETAAEELREARILALLAAHPAQVPVFAHRLEALEPLTPDHAAVQAALLTGVPAGAALARLRARPDVAALPLLDADAEPERVAACLAEEFQRLDADRARRRTTAEAEADLRDRPDEGTTQRLRQALIEYERALRPIASVAAQEEAAEAERLRLAISRAPWTRRQRPPRDGP
jgi:DNA primase